MSKNLKNLARAPIKRVRNPTANEEQKKLRSGKKHDKKKVIDMVDCEKEECEKSKVSNCEDSKVSNCEDSKVSNCEDSKDSNCEDSNDLECEKKVKHADLLECKKIKKITLIRQSFLKASQKRSSVCLKLCVPNQRLFILPKTLFTVGIIVAVLCFFIFQVFHLKEETQTQVHPKRDPLFQLIDKVCLQYDVKSNLTKKILSSALKKVVNVIDPPNPAIITVLTNHSMKDHTKAFCVQLSEALLPHSSIMIDENLYGTGNEEEIKKKIDDEIRNAVDPSSLSSIIVDQIEKIPLKASLIFHYYCDDTNASFKRVIYMFILTLSKDVGPDIDLSELDSIAMKEYENIWKDYHFDVYSSLVTRLTVNVIHI